MIKTYIFSYLNNYFFVRREDKNLYIATPTTNFTFKPIDFLIDLDKDKQEETNNKIKTLKEYMNNLKDDKEIDEYLKKEMESIGFLFQGMR